MSKVLNKQNISIVIDKYTDSQTGKEKNVRRTVGELITMQGNDGSVFQFGKMWGPGGCTEFKIYEQEARKAAINGAAAPAPGYNDNSPPF